MRNLLAFVLLAVFSVACKSAADSGQKFGASIPMNVPLSAINADATTGTVITNTDAGLVYQKATASPYTPANVHNWSDAGPTSIANALDRLAAKSTPIP